MLSFDVEEYFQVEAAAGSVCRADWAHFPRRLEAGLERILQLLADHETSATFFVLGWVGRHERGLVRRIAEAGHEIASHGMNHKMLDRLSPRQFRRDLLTARRILQDISGRPVIGYRAATFSIRRQTAWAIDLLCDAGFLYDSSVFPIRHDRYGVPGAPAEIHLAVGPAGGSILEIPPLTARLLGRNVPLGGGGYLRLLPVSLLGLALKRAERRGRPAMVYLHPWEFDPDQPPLPMSRLSRWRHRVNLRRTSGKLHWLLDHFHFTSVRQCLDGLAGSEHRAYDYALAAGKPARASTTQAGCR